jgi:solute carrier family 7 (cationic amino acid transporter), member 1
VLTDFHFSSAIHLKHPFAFSGDTWMRVGIWLLMGVLVYIFYGQAHSSLKDVVYIPVAQADEIYRTPSGYVS